MPRSMIIRRKIYYRSGLSLFGLAVIFAGSLWGVLSRPVELASAAVSYGEPSVLQMPNIGGAYKDNNVQDVRLIRQRLGDGNVRYGIVDNPSPNRRIEISDTARFSVVEISKVSEHFMKEVKIGVYVTSDAINNGLKLDFIAGNCRVSDNGQTYPNEKDVFEIDIMNEDDTASARSVVRVDSRDLCRRFREGRVGATMDLFNLRDFFKLDENTRLQKMIVRVGYKNSAYERLNILGLVQFRVEMSNTCSDANCRQYVAVIGAKDTVNAGREDDEARNFSMENSANDQPDSRQGGSASDLPQYYLRRFVYFGLPCTQQTAKSAHLNLYDMNDNDWVFNKPIVGVLLQKYINNTWEDLTPGSEYTVENINASGVSSQHSPPNAITTIMSNASSAVSTNPYMYSISSWNSGTKYVIIPKNIDRSTTKIKFDMQPFTRYRIVITPDSARDFTAVGIPADSIYGIIQCSADVEGAVKATPDDTVSDGQTIDFDFFATKFNMSDTDVDSKYKYSTRVWYDTSNEIYDPADGDVEDGCVYNSPDWVVHKTTDSAERALRVGNPLSINGCHDYLVDIGRASRRPAFICASLTLEGGDMTLVRAPATNVKCVRIGKIPGVNLWGGDVAVGRDGTSQNVVTSFRRSSGSRIFGSWAEYAIMASGNVESASAAALSRKEGREVGADVDRLTFANNTSPKGNFAVGRSSDMAGGIRLLYPTTTNIAGASLDVGSLSSSGRYVKASGNLSVSGNPTRSIVIDAKDSVVTIIGNIDYGNATYDSAGRLPQLVIIAKDIIIDDSVTRVDAWLIANDGVISTCDEIKTTPDRYYSGLKIDVCTRQLTINGPVSAGHLQLRRTFGAEAPRGSTGDEKNDRLNDPAEIINLRADTYMWTNAVNSLYGEIRTTHTRDIAPRF